VRATVAGRDFRRIARVDFKLGVQRVARDSKAPFTRTLLRRSRGSRRYVARAVVSVRGSAQPVLLSRSFNGCG
jgi:hypothetical protein